MTAAITTTVCFAVKFVLRVFGAWPEDGSRVVLRRLFWSASLIVGLFFQYKYFIVHFGTDDLADLMDNLSCNLAYSLLLFKLIIFWVNKRKFREILTMIATDWKECANDPFSMNVTTSMASLSQRISNGIIGLHIGGVILYSCSVFLDNIENENLNASSVPVRAYVVKMELPFDSDSTPVYELVLVAQSLQLLWIACAIDVMNALMLTLTFHVGAQIDIVREWLTNIFSKDTLYDVTGITMKRLIGKHQKIIVISENIESLYCYIALMQYISNTLIICAIGFVIVSSVGRPNAVAMLMRSLLYYVIMNLEAFMFCYAGEYLSTKSQHIADVAYGSVWYDMGVSEKRAISFLIMRSQKRLTITIGKVADLSLERFTSVVKASASYISMLLALKERD